MSNQEPKARALSDMDKDELLVLLESQFGLKATDPLDLCRAKWGHHEACRLKGRDAADHVANLLVEVRRRLAESAGLDGQETLCRVAEVLQQVRDVVAMAGHALQRHELVFGVATMSPNDGLRREVRRLEWAMAVLMGRIDDPAPDVS